MNIDDLKIKISNNSKCNLDFNNNKMISSTIGTNQDNFNNMLSENCTDGNKDDNHNLSQQIEKEFCAKCINNHSQHEFNNENIPNNYTQYIENVLENEVQTCNNNVVNESDYVYEENYEDNYQSDSYDEENDSDNESNDIKLNSLKEIDYEFVKEKLKNLFNNE